MLRCHRRILWQRRSPVGLGLLVIFLVACDCQPPAVTEATRAATPAPSASGSTEEGPPPVGVAERPLLSPLGTRERAHLRAIAAAVEGRSGDVFAKVGDSATVSRAFLECFADGELILGDHGELRDTVALFRRGNAGGRSPFRRESLAAGVGWSSRQVLLGEPSPLLREVRAINPRFAFVLGGGNDVEGADPARYANRLLRIVDHLTPRGVVPILGSILPRDDNAEADGWVRRYNAVNRAIARGRALPYIDFHQALDQLPRRGLAGDGVHPNVLIRDGRTEPCTLDEEGLAHGNNVRNLLAMKTLHRLRLLLEEVRAEREAGTPDAESASPPPLATPPGDGSVTSPYRIAALPFERLGDTAGSPHRAVDRYPGCDVGIDESGPEEVYELVIGAPMHLHAWVTGPAGADVDVHLARGAPGDGSCVARGDHEIEATVEPGTWTLTVDTFVTPEGAEAPGEYILAVWADE